MFTAHYASYTVSNMARTKQTARMTTRGNPPRRNHPLLKGKPKGKYYIIDRKVTAYKLLFNLEHMCFDNSMIEDIFNKKTESSVLKRQGLIKESYKVLATLLPAQHYCCNLSSSGILKSLETFKNSTDLLERTEKPPQ